MRKLKNALANNTSGIALGIEKRNEKFISQLKNASIDVYRVEITTAELTAGRRKAAAGADLWDGVIKPILVEKGVPERYLYDGAPFRMTEKRDRLILEFD